LAFSAVLAENGARKVHSEIRISIQYRNIL
jgi:hypothetical protein